MVFEPALVNLATRRIAALRTRSLAQKKITLYEAPYPPHSLLSCRPCVHFLCEKGIQLALILLLLRGWIVIVIRAWGSSDQRTIRP